MADILRSSGYIYIYRYVKNTNSFDDIVRARVGWQQNAQEMEQYIVQDDSIFTIAKTNLLVTKTKRSPQVRANNGVNLILSRMIVK